MSNEKRLIIGNGEAYVIDDPKVDGGRAPIPPRTFEEARDLVKSNVSNSLVKLRDLPQGKKFTDELVLCLRLHPDLTAKSYEPQILFDRSPGLRKIGSRSYSLPIADVKRTKRVEEQVNKGLQSISGRMIFVQGQEEDFEAMLRLLDLPESTLPTRLKDDFQRIERFDILQSSEQLLGFDDAWAGGRVEIVFHPTLRHTETDQINFIKELIGEEYTNDRLHLTTYSSGPTFASCKLTRDALSALSQANPLRTVHPLNIRLIENLRDTPIFDAPIAPEGNNKSVIKVGMFDGGIDTNNPLLKLYCEQDEALSISVPSNPVYVAHGTGVAGVILYGPLNYYDNIKPLPTPPVSVVSFRVLPTSDPNDIDLHESIDVIENVVPARPDIRVYNLSIGPQGPILDDTISRFTYALDSLAAKFNVTFFVAVGNDGEQNEGLDRIQAPSDLVNGMGIGAYTRRSVEVDKIRIEKIVHAPYSCKGPGRETGKQKPDLTAFGGCDQNPIQLISEIYGKKTVSMGTSFASPFAASLAARATESFERGTPLLSRALMMHCAEHPGGQPDELLGLGMVPERLEDILFADANSATIIYQGSIHAKKRVKLPIFLPTDDPIDGLVTLKWTIAALSPVDSRHPDDYTSCCIEETFYPNIREYRFTHPTDKTKSHSLNLIDDAHEITGYLTDGWVQSDRPVSQSGKKYASELVRRTTDLKWEPIVRTITKKRGSSLYKPYLSLHAIPRNGWGERISYAVAITVTAPKFNGDVSNEILTLNSALHPIRLRTQNELEILI